MIDRHTEQGIFFHLNHPIRFVYVCGSVASIREIVVAGPEGRRKLLYVILEVDDSSGETVELKIIPLKKTQAPRPPNVIEHLPRHTSDLQKSGDESDHAFVDARERDEEGNKATAIDLISVDTNIENVKVMNFCCEKDCHDWHVTLAGEIVNVQTIIKAKGTLTKYKGMNQIQLERAFVVRTTHEEMRVWEEYAAFARDVLSHPWVLEKKKLRQLERENRVKSQVAEREHEQRKAKQQAREERREKRREKSRQLEEKAEVRRQQEKAELDGNPLDRPDWKPWPEVERASRRTKNG